jgi:hypothetical protein
MTKEQQLIVLDQTASDVRCLFQKLQSADLVSDWTGAEIRTWLFEQMRLRSGLDRRRLSGKRGKLFKQRLKEIEDKLLTI